MQNLQMLRVARASFWALLLYLACSGISNAQFETANVLGSATDPRGGAIPRTRISLANLDTGTTQSAVTDDSGSYQFLEVRVGRYRVRAEAEGFKTVETPEFRVDVGARQRVDVRLHDIRVSGDIVVFVEQAQQTQIFAKFLQVAGLRCWRGGGCLADWGTRAAGRSSSEYRRAASARCE